MPKIDKENLIKPYYSIGEVAKMFDVNASLIRFWGNEFPTIRLRKNKKGNRMFSPKNILQYDEIYTLVKERGFTLEGAKKAIKASKSTGESPIPILPQQHVIDKLESIRKKLLELHQ